MFSPKLSTASAPLPILATLLLLLACSLITNALDKPSPGAAMHAPSSIWTIESTPNLGQNNILLGLSADSESDIWSVGDLISMHFDGNSWTAIPMVNLGNTAMQASATLSATDVWAVGNDFENGGHNVSVIQHFDGTQWTLVSSPHFASGDTLNGIQAISASDIFAVGSSNTDNPQTVSPLVEHFDGTQWTVVPTPPVGNGALNQIAILSSSDMWAVGETGVLDGLHTTLPFAMHSNGAQWSKNCDSSGAKLFLQRSPRHNGDRDQRCVGGRFDDQYLYANSDRALGRA